MAGSVALITGGTRGIGRAIAGALSAQGHAVALLYQRAEDEAAATRAALEAAGGRASVHQADIGDAAAVRRAVAEVADTLGAPTVLVNNAFRGGRTPAKTHAVPATEWSEDLHTNLTGPFLVTQACLPHMLEASFGRVIFIGSLAARGEPGRVAYSTAKAALSGLSNTVAREYAKSGITSNVVNPGFIAAGAFERLPEEIQSRALKMVPGRRAGTAEEIASLVTYLASEASGYLTGQVIGVDGGVS